MAKQRRSRQSMAGSSPRIVKARSVGEPQPKELRVRAFPKSIIHRLQPRKTIRTLIKQHPGGGTNDVATIAQDASGNKVANGTLLPGGGGYHGVTAVFKPRVITPRQAKGTKVVKTPRPAPGGVRNPYRGREF